jgi:hypothetical protein
VDMDDLDDVEDVDRDASNRMTLLEIRVSRLEEQQRKAAVHRAAEAFEQASQEPWQLPQAMSPLNDAPRVRVVETIERKSY